MTLTAYEKAERKFQREFDELVEMQMHIEAGRWNHHLFRMRKTKEQAIAELRTDGVNLIEKHMMRSTKALANRRQRHIGRLGFGKWGDVVVNELPFAVGTFFEHAGKLLEMGLGHFEFRAIAHLMVAHRPSS